MREFIVWLWALLKPKVQIMRTELYLAASFPLFPSGLDSSWHRLSPLGDSLAAPNLHSHIFGSTSQILTDSVWQSWARGRELFDWPTCVACSSQEVWNTVLWLTAPPGWQSGGKIRCCCQTKGKVTMSWPKIQITTARSISGSLRKGHTESSNVSVCHQCLRKREFWVVEQFFRPKSP